MTAQYFHQWQYQKCSPSKFLVRVLLALEPCTTLICYNPQALGQHTMSGWMDPKYFKSFRIQDIPSDTHTHTLACRAYTELSISQKKSFRRITTKQRGKWATWMSWQHFIFYIPPPPPLSCLYRCQVTYTPPLHTDTDTDTDTPISMLHPFIPNKLETCLLVCWHWLWLLCCAFSLP